MRHLILGLLFLGVANTTTVKAEHVFLRCLGKLDGPRFLDGRTHDGTVGLAPETGGGFTGTKWSIIPAE